LTQSKAFSKSQKIPPTSSLLSGLNSSNYFLNLICVPGGYLHCVKLVAYNISGRLHTHFNQCHSLYVQIFCGGGLHLSLFFFMSVRNVNWHPRFQS